MIVQVPAHITEFYPLIDGQWVTVNLGPDSDSVSISGLDNESFVEVEDTGEKYSLHELQGKLTPTEGETFGSFKKEERFKKGWIVGPDARYKIQGYNVSYTLAQPHHELMVIDFSKELLGVIEYLQKGTKKSIFKEGIIKDNLLPPER